MSGQGRRGEHRRSLAYAERGSAPDLYSTAAVLIDLILLKQVDRLLAGARRPPFEIM